MDEFTYYVQFSSDDKVQTFTNLKDVRDWLYIAKGWDVPDETFRVEFSFQTGGMNANGLLLKGLLMDLPDKLKDEKFPMISLRDFRTTTYDVWVSCRKMVGKA